MVRKAWKWGCLSLVGGLIVTNVLWTYRSLDQSVTISYMHDCYRQTEEDPDVLRDLLPQLDISTTQRDLVVLLRRMSPEGFIMGSGDSVSIEGLEFVFESGQLEAVKHR